MTEKKRSFELREVPISKKQSKFLLKGEIFQLRLILLSQESSCRSCR